MSLRSFFAPAERAAIDELTVEIDLVSKNAIMSGLLHSVSGVLAIVNDKRQVIAFNDSFIKMLGVDDPQHMLGLRPGEILQCKYAHDEPAGCGTSRHCGTCGAAVAMVTSLGENKPAERVCALRAKRGDNEVDLALSVRSQPIAINSKRFVLLFIQDITRQQQQAALERTFFHDVSNLMSMLVGSSELLVAEDSSSLARTVYKAATRLQQEISIQRYLSQGESDIYTPMWHTTSPQDIFDELRLFFTNHPAAKNKLLRLKHADANMDFTTDISLILRVLCNMVTNAFEASTESEEVKIWQSTDDEYISFYVWNAAHINEAIKGRIFQRNFSSKDQSGRGIGTFSMKLLGEKILGGQVNFVSSPAEGTTFRLRLPL